MFDKMVKMKNKKGFTLVEMLVVIAIIAVLVSIVVPLVGSSTVKSRAATNAANLRAIEGQLSTMRVENPLAFESVVEQFGVNFSTQLQQWGVSETASNIAAELIEIFFGDSIEDFVNNSDNIVAQYAKYKLYHNTADENGTLIIPADVAITLENVPASKAVDAGNMHLPEGIPMTVYITESKIVATYEYGNGNYTRLDFAEVAETGNYTGEATGSGGVTEDQFECAFDSHTTKNCVCIVCNKTVHEGPYTDNGADHTCDGCGTTMSHNWSDGVCSDCKKTCAHGSWSTSDSSHTCTVCGQSFDHTCEYVNASTHKCTVCEKTGSHRDGENNIGSDEYCDGCNAKRTRCSCTSSLGIWGCTCSGHTHNKGLGGCEYSTWTK